MKTKQIRKPVAVFCLAAALISAPHAYAAGEAKAAPGADNTAINKRDAKGGTLTPMDQMRGTALDTEITRQIREQITKDKNFSTYARNVKVITLNKNVTLRGPVSSANERERIATIAKSVAGPGGQVVNELEVSR